MKAPALSSYATKTGGDICAFLLRVFTSVFVFAAVWIGSGQLAQKLLDDRNPLRLLVGALLVAGVLTAIAGVAWVAAQLVQRAVRWKIDDHCVAFAVALLVTMAQCHLFDAHFFLARLDLPALRLGKGMVDLSNVLSDDAWDDWIGSPLLKARDAFAHGQTLALVACALYFLHAWRFRVSLYDRSVTRVGFDCAVAPIPAWKHTFVFAPDSAQCVVYGTLACMAYVLPLKALAVVVALPMVLYLPHQLYHSGYDWTFYGFEAVLSDAGNTRLRHEITKHRHTALKAYGVMLVLVLLADAHAHQGATARLTKLQQFCDYAVQVAKDCAKLSALFDTYFHEEIKDEIDAIADFVDRFPGRTWTLLRKIARLLSRCSHAVVEVLGPHAVSSVRVFTTLPKRAARLVGARAAVIGDGGGKDGIHVTMCYSIEAGEFSKDTTIVSVPNATNATDPVTTEEEEEEEEEEVDDPHATTIEPTPRVNWVPPTVEAIVATLATGNTTATFGESMASFDATVAA